MDDPLKWVNLIKFHQITFIRVFSFWRVEQIQSQTEIHWGIYCIYCCWLWKIYFLQNWLEWTNVLVADPMASLAAFARYNHIFQSNVFFIKNIKNWNHTLAPNLPIISVDFRVICSIVVLEINKKNLCLHWTHILPQKVCC